MWPGRAVRRGTPKQRMVFGPPVSRSTIVLVLLQLFSTSRVTAVRRLAEWSDSACASDRTGDCRALKVLYTALGYKPSNWGTTETFCSGWSGITCNTDGRVSQLYLPSKSLVGTLPDEIGNLSELQTLYMYSNTLSGTIPRTIGNLTKLTVLSVMINQLSGTLPVEISRMTSLRTLDLAYNLLTGTIPGNLTASMLYLQSLHLNGNFFSQWGSKDTCPISNNTVLSTLSCERAFAQGATAAGGCISQCLLDQGCSTAKSCIPPPPVPPNPPPTPPSPPFKPPPFPPPLAPYVISPSPPPPPPGNYFPYYYTSPPYPGFVSSASPSSSSSSGGLSAGAIAGIVIGIIFLVIVVVVAVMWGVVKPMLVTFFEENIGSAPPAHRKSAANKVLPTVLPEKDMADFVAAVRATIAAAADGGEGGVPPKPVPVPHGLKFHCFLSHDWGTDERGLRNHDTVALVNEGLKKRGLSTWFDAEKMDGNIDQTMAAGIDYSATVVVFVTKNYLQEVNTPQEEGNDNCSYAKQQKPGRIIPVPMEPAMRNPANWTGAAAFGIGGLLYPAHFASEDEQEFVKEIDNLAVYIAQKCGGAKPPK